MPFEKAFTMRLPTIKDVAAQAGVGIGTVSRVLNNSTQVSVETRTRVLQVIHDLGFKPNRSARQLSKGIHTNNIGVMMPFVTSYSFVERLRGVQTALEEMEYAYELILYNVSSVERYNLQLEAILRNGGIAGLLLIALHLTEAQQKQLSSNGIAFVAIHDHCRSDIPCVGLDNVAAAQLAVDHLIQLGHRRIAYIGDNFDNDYEFNTSRDRYRGYCAALQRHGLSIYEDYVQLGPFGKDAAYNLTRRLFEMRQPPTAIFAMSDAQALGCIAAVKDAGLDVPDDVSVIGFDDIELSAYAGLTTVRQHLVESGRRAALSLLQLLSGEQPDENLVMPQPQVIIRQTTKAAPI